ncbi:MAG: hypothetical protein LBJ02_03065 [Bifidobacteriaceae bacterium]|nr:hypothetical protein [Bifidobacteriaceae bacterium]
MRTFLARRFRRRDEDGITMVTVLVAMSLTLVVAIGSLTFLTASTKYSRYDQDVELATAAALSGVADLLTELRVDPGYLTHIEETKTADTGYCRKEAVGGPLAEGDDFHEVCGWPDNQAPRYLKLGGEEGGSAQSYHYVINEVSESGASIIMTSTGRSHNVYRSIQTRFTRENTAMWLYITNYELSDPTPGGTYEGASNLAAPIYGENVTAEACGAGWAPGITLGDLGYAWETPVWGGSGAKPAREYVRAYLNQTIACSQPYFVPQDVLDGKVHSNDSIQSVGATFLGELTSANPRCLDVDPNDSTKSSWNKCVTGDMSDPDGPRQGFATFGAQAPSYREALALPTVQDPKYKATEGGVGCLYEGPTRIIFNGKQMRVWSKESTTERTNCGSVSELASEDGALVDIPLGSMIYVNSATGVEPKEIAAGAIGGPAGRKLPLGSFNGNPPTSAGQTHQGEYVMSAEKGKRDGLGNLWIEGHMTGGNITVAADRSIIITGDLLADDDNKDLIGLMSGESIEIYNPVAGTTRAVSAGTWADAPEMLPDPYVPMSSAWPTDYDGNSGVLRVEAAMHASGASFRVQNSGVKGQLGKLQVFGAIAQNFRGVVGTFHFTEHNETIPFGGYEKDYKYNPRLTSGPPLLFEPISNGAWLTVWQEKFDTPEHSKLP